MNILFVSTDYPKRGQPTTGFPNYLYRVSLSLIQLGHKPMILAAGDMDDHRTEQGIEIRIVGIRTYNNYKMPTCNYVSKALRVGYKLNRAIKDILRQTYIDVIQFTSLSGIALFYHGNVPAVLRLSSYARTAFSTNQTYSSRTVEIIAFMERMSSKRCSAVFSPSKNNAVVFGNDCKRSVAVIETPFVNDVEEYDFRYYDCCLKGKKYVLFFGTLYAEKGILVIAEILERFLENNPAYYFVMIGDAANVNGENARQMLYRKAGKHADRLIISNALGHKELYPVIRSADFVVLPSLMENLSNACIEAMYFERIVIGTDGASFEQLIVHGKNGLLCRIGDSQDLFDKMQTAVCMSEADKLKMGKLAKRRIDRLKPEYAVAKLVRLYTYVTENYKIRKG
ncbi:MAG: glycosyltransferase family 4 protein [Ruminococcus flavefaciens]|nr:glycosyltransferase family 4 protein [Roseburia sp.]MCM1231442.1 glycosyltransferase family 4 protein [Ruminococcus flavefaciens]